MSYLALLRSMHQWFASRGEAEPHARYAAAIACSVLLSMNIASITLFAHALLDVSWYRILGNIPLHAFALLVMVVFHSWLLKHSQGRGQLTNYPSRRSRESSPPIWLVYLVFSVGLLFAGVLLVSR
jgi:hypothetical protein